MELDLALVMPVYNEEGCIVSVLESWCSVLSETGMKYRLIVLNDGSKDRTREVLTAFKNNDRVEIINKENSGHGPTILEGYKTAVKLSDWVFQCDSDDEMKPDSFPVLWNARDQYDALFGIRTNRVQGTGRKFISAVSRLTVRFLFGSGVTDVNTPYRLIRSEILERIVNQIPENTFAPNVIISGVLSRARLRIFETEVPHTPRKTGTISIVKWKLWKSVMKAFIQTVACRPKL